MAAIVSRLNPASGEFERNRLAMMRSVDRLRELEARTRARSESSKPAFDKRAALLPRERIGRLLDLGSPWLELSSLAGYGLDSPDPLKSVPGAGVICGIGYVSSVRCAIVASDSGINAGAIGPKGLEKMVRVQEIALANKLPFVHLVESAGANLLRYRVETFVNGGQLFRNLARLSAAGCPVVTAVHGSSTAGGAYF
ncbi:MAG: acyl-CoA carboxylase subunit beta, partial [Candidatus Eremiobacteraeota bacterium]|nr:acyl-CoA carboxylase subunit beta [Candidatus Eremiobacteraeota bacterium]